LLHQFNDLVILTFECLHDSQVVRLGLVAVLDERDHVLPLVHLGFHLPAGDHVEEGRLQGGLGLLVLAIGGGVDFIALKGQIGV
jgi:hypothetical protein